MSKKISLSIAEPCHENWDNMSPDNKGKFCGSCQKQVIDFSYMNDQQLAEFFKKPSTGSVCGRFMNDQLEKEIEIPKKRIPWVKYFFQLALPAFFFSKASSQQIKMGKIAKPVIKDTIRTPMINEPHMLGMVINNNILPVVGDTIMSSKIIDAKVIKGKIVNEKGDPIPFASIQLMQTKNLFAADENGEFEIKYILLGKNKVLSISSVGFEKKDVIIENSEKPLKIALATIKMGDVIVSSQICNAIKFIKVGGVSVKRVNDDKKEYIPKDMVKPQTEKNFTVYPNPALTGGSFSISLIKIEEGYYTVSFINLSGQQIQQINIWIDGETKVLNMEVPAIAAGSYFLVLTNKKTKKKMTEKIIIQ